MRWDGILRASLSFVGGTNSKYCCRRLSHSIADSVVGRKTGKIPSNKLRASNAHCWTAEPTHLYTYATLTAVRRHTHRERGGERKSPVEGLGTHIMSTSVRCATDKTWFPYSFFREERGAFPVKEVEHPTDYFLAHSLSLSPWPVSGSILRSCREYTNMFD